VGIASWDEQMMSSIDAHRTSALDDLTTWVTKTGTSPVVLAIGVAVCVAVMIWRRWYRVGAAAAAAFLLATVAADVLKQVFDRGRPPWRLALIAVDGPSFPSTHAATTSAVAVAVLVSVAWGSRRQAVTTAAVLLTSVAFVGACMVYVGAHWVTDVLAGWALGAAIGAAVGWLARPRSRGVPEPVGHARVGHAR
jgi:undecaprenyl-diphosphatase